MSDEIPEWAAQRACDLANAERAGHRFWEASDVNARAYGAPLQALARYIAEHEEAPDPVEDEIRRIYGEWMESDLMSGVEAIRIALRRGMELAQEKSL